MNNDEEPIGIIHRGSLLGPLLVQEFKNLGIKAQLVEGEKLSSHANVFVGDPSVGADVEYSMNINKAAFQSLKQAVELYDEKTPEHKSALFVTIQGAGGAYGHGTQNSDRIAELNQAYAAGLGGLIKTLKLERPEFYSKNIDIDFKGDLNQHAKSIVHEIVFGGGESDIGFGNAETRLVFDTHLQALKRGPIKYIDQNSFLIVTGGAKGVTQKVMLDLMRENPCKLLILGRTNLTEEDKDTQRLAGENELKGFLVKQAMVEGVRLSPLEVGRKAKAILSNREVQKSLAEYRNLGAEVSYLGCDVNKDLGLLSDHIEKLRKEWGPVTGFVHGAGVIVDRFIKDKTEDQFNMVFDTKVNGARQILSLLENDPLNVLIFFSSITARNGNKGQCDYGMANEVLNRLALFEQKKRGETCLVRSLMWGPWEGGMVSPALKDMFTKKGVPLVSYERGADLFVKEFCNNSLSEVELVMGPDPKSFDFNGEGLISEGHKDHFYFYVHKSSDSYLMSHKVNDTVVVPLAQVIEWFRNAAQRTLDSMHFRELSDIQMFKGILLPDFSEKGSWFEVETTLMEKKHGQAKIALKLKDKKGVPYYKALAILTSEEQVFDLQDEQENVAEWEKADYQDPEYKSPLFHGPDLQVIKSLGMMNSDSARAVMKSGSQYDWCKNHDLDIATLDGGLQLALLWTKHVTGAASLPTGIGAFKSFQKELPKGEVRCVLRKKSVQDKGAVSDLIFYDQDHKPWASLEDVATFTAPNLH